MTKFSSFSFIKQSFNHHSQKTEAYEEKENEEPSQKQKNNPKEYSKLISQSCEDF